MPEKYNGAMRTLLSLLLVVLAILLTLEITIRSSAGVIHYQYDDSNMHREVETRATTLNWRGRVNRSDSLEVYSPVILPMQVCIDGVQVLEIPARKSLLLQMADFSDSEFVNVRVQSILDRCAWP